MTEKLTAYTPLESLLLFQSLVSNGVDPSAFSRTSDFLNNNPFVRGARTYDSGRLSPDALRELYLGLLKEEVKAELEASNSDDGTAGNVSPGPTSKKRKRSPSLPSVQEAAQHEYLIPHLIARLYLRYREHIVGEIREDERTFTTLQAEVQKIEQGAWDETLLAQTNSHARTSTSPEASIGRDRILAAPHQTSDLPQGLQDSYDRFKHPSPGREVINIAQAYPESVIDHPQNNTARVPAPDADLPRDLLLLQPSTSVDRVNQQSTPQPRLPPPRPSESGYRLNSPSIHQSPYAPSPNPPFSRSSITHSPVPYHGTLDGRSLPPSSQNLPYLQSPPVNVPQPPQAGYSHPYGPVSSYPSAVGPSHEAVQTHAFPPHPPQAQPPIHSNRQSVPAHHAYIQRQGGVMLPPFQLDVQAHGRLPHQQLSPQSAISPARSHPTPTQNRAVAPKTIPTTQPQPQLSQTQIKELQDIAAQLAVNPSKGRTGWRKVPNTLSVPHRKSPTRPLIEPLSPVEQELSEPERTSIIKGNGRSPRRAHEVEDSNEKLAAAVPLAYSEGRNKTGRMRNRKARGGSVSSSAVASSARERTRSQSVISHDAESSMQETEAASQRTVKPEPPSTPAGSGNLSDFAASESTPNDARTTRRLVGTLQARPFESATFKRKRPIREVSEGSDHLDSTKANDGKQYINASRNFARTSATIMNDITSHKHASLFAQPVRERQAEGYKDIVRRPQDLKSIRKAITDGARAIAAMTSSASNATSFDTSQPPLASPGGSGAGSVWLPAHPDIMPPKGIVNSSQLEKEVMRMFANAVMFNTGDEGMVIDTREMADDVQGMLRVWRDAERTQVGTPVHVGGRGRGDEEEGVDEGEGVAKRRKL
ncbi:MAG: hypothetical protein M1820_008719 [Bogoriella megaspora]|nr:MAG: hypothetical protein M1820_008719 [Bogoriella megaspora]